MIDEAPANQPPVGRHGRMRLLIGGGTAVVIIAAAAHLAGGVTLLHSRPGEALANLSGGALAIILVAIVGKVLLIHGARRAFPRR